MDIISLTVSLILFVCIIYCAVTLGQIRDILRDIRDGKKRGSTVKVNTAWQRK